MTTPLWKSAVADEKQFEADSHSLSTAVPQSIPSEKSSQELDVHRSSLDPNVEHGVPVVDPSQDADTKETIADTSPSDPNVVDWESPDDPAKALNWTVKKKWANLAVISFITFLTPLASSMVAPAVPEVMREFNTTDTTIGSFVVSIYLLGYVIGPLFLAPLSEVYGRLPVYHANNILFTIWSLGCALSPNIGALLVFRLLAGIAGSCPLTIGGGSIADVFIQSQRGGAMAIFGIGPLLGPVIGPVAGGFLAQDAGWRWIFWLLTIAGGVSTCVSLVFMRETYEPVLLERRVKALRKETGNPNLRSKLASDLSQKDFFIRAIIRPTKMLFMSPIVLILSIYMATVYGYLYLLFTTLTLVFEYGYGFNQGNVGLTFLGIGIGSLLGLLIFGIVSDRLLKKLSANGEMKPEYRLPPVIPGSFLIPIGLFWYGWSAEYRLHWIMPIIGTMWVGLGMLGTFMGIQTYFVDAFTLHAASAIAANTVLRSLVGAFLPLAGPKMYAALGLGWGNSLLAFIALAMCPFTWVFFKYGERIRKSPRFKVEF